MNVSISKAQKMESFKLKQRTKKGFWMCQFFFGKYWKILISLSIWNLPIQNKLEITNSQRFKNFENSILLIWGTYRLWVTRLKPENPKGIPEAGRTKERISNLDSESLETSLWSTLFNKHCLSIDKCSKPFNPQLSGDVWPTVWTMFTRKLHMTWACSVMWTMFG